MRAGVDLFQMDAGLSYGLTEYARMIETLESHGFDRGQCHPHGGHLINLHIVIALSLGGCEAYPGVFQPFGGYSSACHVDNGFVACSDAPGFGLEQKSELVPYLHQLPATRQLQQELQAVLPCQVQEDANLQSLGLDSRKAVETGGKLSELTKTKLPQTLFLECKTPVAAAGITPLSRLATC